jgi:hypothetical protein
VDVSYTVTPSLTGYTFSPVNSVANVSGADVTGKNFVATAIPINVSGTWTGTGYSPETGTSPTAVIFSQSGNSVSGTWDGDAVTGTVSGNQLTLTVTPFTQNGWSLTGNISATVTGNSMSGTLSMTGRSGSTSTTANGTFTVTRSGSVAVTLYNAYDAPAGGFIAAIVGAIAE